MQALRHIKGKIKFIIPLIVGVLLIVLAFIVQLGIYKSLGFVSFPLLDSVNSFIGFDKSHSQLLISVLICLSILIFFVLSIRTKYEYNFDTDSLMSSISYDKGKISKKWFTIIVLTEITILLYIFIKHFWLNSYHGYDIFIWLLSIVVPALGIYLYEANIPDYSKLKLSKDEIFFLLCVFIFLLSISLPALSLIPFVVHYDEATIGNLAREFMNDDVNAFGLNKWYGYPNLSFYPAYLVLNFISNDLWGLRLYGVISVLISVIPFYYLAKFLFNKEIAAIASIIMYSGHCFFFFFRNGMYHTDGLIIYSIVCFFFIAGMRLNSKLFIYLSGVFCAFGFYVYMSARVMIILILLYMFVIFLITVKKKLLLKHLLVLITGFMICMLPLGLNIDKNMKLSTLRASQINILTSERAYKHASGRYKMDSESATLVNTIANHLWISLKSFNYGRDTDRQYSIPRPFLDFITSFLFLLGLPYVCIMIFKAKKQKWFVEIYDERYLLLALTFWVVLILGWVINVDPPTYQKMPIIMPAIAIICSLVLYNIAYYMVKNFNSPILKKLIKTSFLSIILLAVIMANFEVFLHSGTLGLERNDFYLTDTLLSYYANDKARKEGKAEFYLIGFKNYLDFSLEFLREKGVTYNYISHHRLKQSLPIDKIVSEDKYFVINPKYDQRCEGINYLNQYYPGGKTKIIKNLRQNIMLVFYYVPKSVINDAIRKGRRK